MESLGSGRLATKVLGSGVPRGHCIVCVVGLKKGAAVEFVGLLKCAVGAVQSRGMTL